MKQPQLRPLAAAIQRLFVETTKHRVQSNRKPTLPLSTGPRSERITLGGIVPLGAVIAGMAFGYGDAFAQSAQSAAGEITLPSV